MHTMHVCHSVLMHLHVTQDNHVTLSSSHVREFICQYNIIIKYKEMTWFSGKSFGSYLGGARFEFLLAPLFLYKFTYLFY